MSAAIHDDGTTALTVTTTNRQLDRLAFEPDNWDDATRMAKALCNGKLLPQALASNPDAVVTVLVLGRELGLTAMQSLRGIYIVQGRPTMSAQLMVALVLQSGLAEYFDMIDSSAAIATYVTKRKGSKNEVKLSWTIEQARGASLLGKETWKSYPAAMLRARASAELCRAVYPDVVAGLYDPEEVSSLEPQPGPARQRKSRQDSAPSSEPDEDVIDVVPEPVAKPAPISSAERAQILADLASLETLMGGKDTVIAKLGPWPTTPRLGAAYLAKAKTLHAETVAKPVDDAPLSDDDTPIDEAPVQPKELAAPHGNAPQAAPAPTSKLSVVPEAEKSTTGGLPHASIQEFWSGTKRNKKTNEDVTADCTTLFGADGPGKMKPEQRAWYLRLLDADLTADHVALDTVELFGVAPKAMTADLWSEFFEVIEARRGGAA